MRASPFRKRLLAALLPLALAATTSSAHATLSGGTTFEGSDGNTTLDGGTDWVSFKGNPNLIDPDPSGGSDDSLGGGSKDDDTSLTVGTGSIPPNKNDLSRFFVQSEMVGNNNYLYMAWTRTNNLGNANFSIEINKLVQDAPVAGKPWNLRRSDNDLLFLYDFNSSNNSYTLTVAKWSASKNKWGTPSALGGNAEAGINKTTINDPVTGAQFAPLTFGEMAINLTGAGLLTTNCQGFGSAMVRSRASSSFDSELKDFIAPQRVAIARTADPTGAKATGNALGLSLSIVTAGSGPKPVFAVNLPNPSGNNPSVSSSATGQKGQSVSDTQNASQAEFKYPQNDTTLNNTKYKAGGVITVGAVRNTSTSTVDVNGARQSTTSELLGLSLVGGLVTADVVSAVATTEATDRSSSASTIGSGFTNLKVAGNAISSNANAYITLTASQYGPNSFVSVYEVGPGKQTGTTSQPKLNQLGEYKADVTVTMIHVHITDDNGPTTTPLLGKLSPGYGGNTIDFTIDSATAHSEFYGMACTAQEVGAQAAVLQATVVPLGSVVLNYVAIPRAGGYFPSTAATINVGGSGAVPSIVNLTAAGAVANGVVIPFVSSESNSYASVATACVLPVKLTNSCTIYLDVLKSAAHALATSSGASADVADTAVVATIGNVKINAPPNTRVDLPGLGFVILNEQACDGGGVPDSNGVCAGTTKAGVTVRGVHVNVTIPLNLLGVTPGADIIVNEAHADASFPPL